MLREAGHKSDPLTNEEMTQFLVPNKNPKGPRRQGAQGGGSNNGGQQNERKRFPTKTKSGDELCLPFNSDLGCLEGTKAGVTPGASCQRGGAKYLHVCSYYHMNTKELCGKKHTKVKNHKR